MKTRQLQLEGVLIEYKISGNGPRTLISLHGFDQTIDSFDILLNDTFKQQYTMYSVALFYHGSQYLNSNYRSEPLKLSDQRKIILELCRKEGFDKFNLIGYSIGGRIVLALLEEMHERIENVFL